MNGSGLPPEVAQFILDHINSVVQLEVLLLLRRMAATWTPEAVGRELRIEREPAFAQLEDLRKGGFVVLHDGSYTYKPVTPELQQRVDTLAAAYEDHRVTVIGMIYSKPSDKIRVFADAFRIRKGE